MDESHGLKNSKSKRTKTLFPIIAKAERRILLSGTPALSRPLELHTQIQLIEDLFPKFSEYGIRYCNGFESKFGWDWRGSSHQSELQLIMEKFIMIRRMKSVVLSQLPPKIRQQVFLHVPEKDLKSFSKKIQKIEEQSPGKISSFFEHGGGDASIPLEMMELWTACAAIKMPAMKEYILNLLESESKILLFGHHKDVMNAFDEFFKEKEIGFIRIDGTTPSSSRFELCDKFQNNESVKVALLSITAAGVGLTLTRASTVVFSGKRHFLASHSVEINICCV